MSTSNFIHKYKKSALQLIKNLKSGNYQQQNEALNRFKILKRSFPNNSNLQEVIEKVRYKHALTVIAVEAGFSSWLALKQKLETPAELNFNEFFGLPKFGGCVNHWFNSYELAKNYQLNHGGYLFPYRNHYFVAESAFIEGLKLDANDEDWKFIGYDWQSPTCPHAWHRLKRKLVKQHSVVL